MSHLTHHSTSQPVNHYASYHHDNIIACLKNIVHVKDIIHEQWIDKQVMRSSYHTKALFVIRLSHYPNSQLMTFFGQLIPRQLSDQDVARQFNEIVKVRVCIPPWWPLLGPCHEPNNQWINPIKVSKSHIQPMWAIITTILKFPLLQNNNCIVMQSLSMTYLIGMFNTQKLQFKVFTDPLWTKVQSNKYRSTYQNVHKCMSLETLI